MSATINPVKVQNSNSCPHGLPAGACPICNGMGGGSKKDKAVEKKDPGEWSYAKCLSVGMQMKAAKAHSQETQQMFEKQMQNALRAQQKIFEFIDKAQSLLQSIQAKLPPELQGIFNNTVNAIINPILNLIAKIPQGLEKINEFINNIRSQLLGAMEKLNAIIGEIKNFIERNVVEKFKRLTKRIIKFFNIFGANEENYKNDEEIETLKARELRKIHATIMRIRKEGEKDAEYTCD